MLMKLRLWRIAGLAGLLLLFVGSVCAFPGVAAAAPLLQDEPVIHVVRAGDTLYRIAQQYGTTVDLIVAANDITDASYIEVGEELIIPGGSGVAAESPQGVAKEDTLALVARRFHTSTLALAELNGVVSPTTLPIGNRLNVPGQPPRRVHQVAPNETAVGLALRFDVPFYEFLAANDLSSGGSLVPGERVWIPGDPVTHALPPAVEVLEIGPVPVLQGHTVRVRADVAPDTQLWGVFEDEVLHFAAVEDTRYALFGIHALAEPGTYTLALLAEDPGGDQYYLTKPLRVVPGDYEYEEIVLTAERDALLNPEALATERARLDEIRWVYNPERYWEGLFRRPISSSLTSLYGTRRLYKSPSYEFYGYHEGTDFHGLVGDQVFAPAAGVVVLAEPLYVRGGAIVIDHGWGVYTGYWHLSQIDVAVGDRVEPGSPIGLVGHTGLSTGSHLHWDFWVNGTNVSALQWTEQEFP
jgi:murein DD-endopeptidase MepM/ murein hydrolase activator NlpD